ncbi:hypothetical protein NB496_04185, partial [Vibrio alginolyticus]|uniref:hypothetical protein n=2 Tax=Vibrio TaxID=662 RepID=UPI00215C2049
MNVIYSFSGNILSLLSNFLWLTIFNRSFNLSSVDSYLTILSVSAPIFVLLNLDLRRLASIDVEVRYNNYEYLILRSLFNSLASFLSFSIVLAVYDFDILLLSIILASKVFEAISDLVFGLYTRLNNHRYILLNKAVKFFITFAVVIIYETKWLILDYNSLLLLYFVSFSIPFFTIDLFYIIKHSSKRRLYYSNIKKLFLSSKDLGIEAFLLTIASSYPVLFLSYFGTGGEVTFFGSIAYVVTALQVTFASIFYATAGDLKRKFDKDPKRTLQTVRKVSLVTAVLFCLLSVLFSELVTKLIISLFKWDISLEQIQVLLILRVFSLVFILLSSVFSSVLLFDGELKIQKKVRGVKFFLLLMLSLMGYLFNGVDVVLLAFFILISNLIETSVFLILV